MVTTQTLHKHSVLYAQMVVIVQNKGQKGPSHALEVPTVDKDKHCAQFAQLGHIVYPVLRHPQNAPRVHSAAAVNKNASHVMLDTTVLKALLHQ